VLISQLMHEDHAICWLILNFLNSHILGAIFSKKADGDELAFSNIRMSFLAHEIFLCLCRVCSTYLKCL
jgi:hypothetical protein